MRPASLTHSGLALLRDALLGATLLLALAGCAGRGADLPRMPQSSPAYRLAPGDQLRLITAGDDMLSGEFRVADNGRVALPLLGPVQAATLTPRGFQDEVAARLRAAGLFRDPSVSVEVLTYRPVYVLGEVNRPGQYPYQAGMTVVSAVAAAGGFSYRAVKDYAGVVRTDEGSPLEGRATRQDFVQPGDVITIYERRF
jgi:polysaccharide export outer membrane protein